MSDLSDLSPHSRFSDRADDYAKYRPTYPQAAIDWILEGLGPPSRLRIADIGAGTGISSWLLAERGVQIVALEPNAEMLAHAKRHTRIRYAAGTAEATGLAAGTIDIVTAFQAFHWFAPEPTMREFCRILKRRGRLAAIWNARNREDPFTLAYSDLIETFGDEVTSIERGRGSGSVTQTLTEGGFTRVLVRDFPHFHRMDHDNFIGYARSASYLPREGTEYGRLFGGLEEIYGRFADPEGYVVFPYLTKVFRADRG